MMVNGDTSLVSSVWSAFGHVFIHEDGHESCLTCGATYLLLVDEADPYYGAYSAANGDDPMPCTGDTSMEHGELAVTPCNCLHCTG
jgi:hypothetical protein